jgi:hypothetical protein
LPSALLALSDTNARSTGGFVSVSVVITTRTPDQAEPVFGYADRRRHGEIGDWHVARDVLQQFEQRGRRAASPTNATPARVFSMTRTPGKTNR